MIRFRRSAKTDKVRGSIARYSSVISMIKKLIGTVCEIDEFYDSPSNSALDDLEMLLESKHF